MWFSVACFGVRLSVMFHLMFVHFTLVRFWLLSGHLLGNSCPLGWSFVLIVFCLFVFYSFPILVLRAGFWLLIAPVPVHCFSITLTQENG